MPFSPWHMCMASINQSLGACTVPQTQVAIMHGVADEVVPCANGKAGASIWKLHSHEAVAARVSWWWKRLAKASCDTKMSDLEQLLEETQLQEPHKQNMSSMSSMSSFSFVSKLVSLRTSARSHGSRDCGW